MGEEQEKKLEQETRKWLDNPDRWLRYREKLQKAGNKSILQRWQMEGANAEDADARHDPQENLDNVKRTGLIHPEIPSLRHMIMHSLGLRRSRNAETMVYTGCVVPYGMTLQILAYFRVMDILGVKYTFEREKEFCCMAPCLEGVLPDKWPEAEQVTQEAMDLNAGLARSLGARSMSYVCYMCYVQGQRVLRQSGIEQNYFLDPLIGPLQGRKLKIPYTRIAYYQGCWARPKIMTPDLPIEERLAEYRRWVGKVDGAEVVDLNWKTCCWVNPGGILEEANKIGADCVVTPCTGCWVSLDRQKQDTMPILFTPELLLEALGQPALRPWRKEQQPQEAASEAKEFDELAGANVWRP